MDGSPVDLTVSLNSIRLGSMTVPFLMSKTARSRYVRLRSLLVMRIGLCLRSMSRT